MKTNQLGLATILIATICAGSTMAQENQALDEARRRMEIELTLQNENRRLQQENAKIMEESIRMRAELDELRAALQSAEENLEGRAGTKKTVVVRLNHADAYEVAEVVRQVSRHSGTRLSVMERNNSLVLRGHPEEIEQIQALIAEIDVPIETVPEIDRGNDESERNLAVTIDFIQAKAGSDAPGDLPQNLKEVGEALAGSGFGDFRLFGHLMARVREGRSFESNGMVRSGRDGFPDSFLRVRGEAKTVDGRPAAFVEINANIETPVMKSGSAKKAFSYQDFGVRTASRVPFGEYLVLGAVPATVENSDTILMVIHVTAD